MSHIVNPTLPQGPIRLTFEDYLDLPADGKRYEIMDGELFVTPAPTPRHQGISGVIFHHLFLWAENRGAKCFTAPIDVLFSDQTVVQPDILLLRREHLNVIGERNIQGPPDLVIEILSSSTHRTDILVKSTLYARFGVPCYWIVDPDLDRIEQFRLENGGYRPCGLFASPQTMECEDFEGLKLPLGKVFS